MVKRKNFVGFSATPGMSWSDMYDTETKNNVPNKTGKSLLSPPDFEATDPSVMQGYQGEFGLATKLKKGEGRADGFVSHTPENLFANNEVSGPGRKRNNNLFRWGKGSED